MAGSSCVKGGSRPPLSQEDTGKVYCFLLGDQGAEAYSDFYIIYTLEA